MGCGYVEYIDKLLEGKLNGEKEQELIDHSRECGECSAKLAEVDKMDLLIKKELSHYPYESRKDLIIREAESKKSNSTILSALFNTRKYSYSIAIVLILIITVLFIKPLLNNIKYAYKENIQNNVSNTGENEKKDSASDNIKALEEDKKHINELINNSLQIQYGISNRALSEVFSSKFISKIQETPNLYYKKELKPYKVLDINIVENTDNPDDRFVAFVRVEDALGSTYVQVIQFIIVNGNQVIDDIEYDI